MHQTINEKLPKISIDLGKNAAFEHDIKTGADTVAYGVCNLHSGNLSFPIAFTYRDSNKYDKLITPVHPSFNQYVLRTKSPTASKDNFTYVDGSGKQISFTTKYYYTDSADTHIYVSGDAVIADADGKLHCTVDDERHEVYIERKSDTGLTLMATIEGVNGIAKVEQHSAEIAQLEDVIKEYEKAIKDINYSIAGCDDNTLNALSKIKCSSNCEFYTYCEKSLETAETKPYSCNLLWNFDTKSAYYQSFVTAVIQRNIAEKTYANLFNQRHIENERLYITYKQLEYQDKSLELTQKEFLLNKRYSKDDEVKIWKFYEDFATLNACIRAGNDATYFDNLIIIERQLLDAKTQLQIAELNLKEIKKNISKQRTLIKDYEEKLAEKRQELKTLYHSTPEVFITDNRAVYCFALSDYEPFPSDSTGYRLIGIIDNYDNQLNFSYDGAKMVSVSGNNNGNLLSCKYDHNGNLSCISDMHGHDISFEKTSSYCYRISGNNSTNILYLELDNEPTFTYDNIRKLTISKKYDSNYRKYNYKITDSIKVNNVFIKNDIYTIDNYDSTIVRKNDDVPVCYRFGSSRILFYTPESITSPKITKPQYCYTHDCDYISGEQCDVEQEYYPNLDKPAKTATLKNIIPDTSLDKGKIYTHEISDISLDAQKLYFLVCNFNSNDIYSKPFAELTLNGSKFTGAVFAISNTQCACVIPFRTQTAINDFTFKLIDTDYFMFYDIELAFYECDSIKNTYNAKNLLVTSIKQSKDIAVQKYSYNKNDLLIESTIDIISKGTYTANYVYNNQGSLLRQTDFDGMVTEYLYDKRGIQIGEKHYNSLNPDVYYQSDIELDDEGKTISETDELGRQNQIVYSYDIQDRVSGVINADSSAQSYIYDDDGNILSVTSDDGIETNSNVFEYDTFGNVSKVSHAGSAIAYTYNYFKHGALSAISVCGNQYASFTESKLEDSVTYATNEKFISSKDKDGNVTSVKYKKGDSVPTEIITNEYDSNGNLIKHIDKTLNLIYTKNISYDDSRVKRAEFKLLDTVLVSSDYEYNDDDALTSEHIFVVNNEQVYNYSYTDGYNKRLCGVDIDNVNAESVEYDSLGRVKKLINADICKVFSYLSRGGRTCDLVSQVREFKANKLINTTLYRYSKCNNLVSVVENGVEQNRYTYDKLNRLVRENNRKSNTTTLYTYDNSGNILEKITYPYFDTAYPTVEPVRRDNYSYPMDGWSDRLLSFNNEQCEYDSIGNPILYRGKTLTWQYGRQLATFDNVAYNYYSDGLRREKSANGNSILYFWSDNRLLAESRNGNCLLFKYGISGILGFSFDDINYTYRKNLQGDITDIVDDSGKVVAHYDYDAYGNQRIYGYHNDEWVLLEDTLTHEGVYANSTMPMQLPYLLSDINQSKSNHIAYINPFRYRSYYYDTETNLYYLTSRYYDPETGRFINADDISILDTTKDYIGGLNLYAYCLNNPINTADDDGTMPNWLKWLVGGIAFVASIVLTAVTGGALAPLFVSMGVSIVAGGLIQGTINAISGGSFGQGFADGMADGALWGGVFAFGSSTIGAIKAISTAKRGITIGKNMKRVRAAAKLNNTAHYNPMKGYKTLHYFSPKLADKLSIYHNKIWINRMMNLNAKIIDIGLGQSASAGAWYGMELREIARRGYQVIKFLF